MMSTRDSGFGIIIKGQDLSEKVFPHKETLSKPIPKGKNPVEHYAHEYKHQIGKKPPKSLDQAIAIGLSVERKKKQDSASKGILTPTPMDVSSQQWRPAPRSKLNRMRIWDRKHGKWVYRERQPEDDAVWGVPPGAAPAQPKKRQAEPPTEETMVTPAEQLIPPSDTAQDSIRKLQDSLMRRTRVSLEKLLREETNKKRKKAIQGVLEQKFSKPHKDVATEKLFSKDKKKRMEE